MKISQVPIVRFKQINVGVCFKLLDDSDAYIKISTELDYDRDAVNLVTGIGVHINEDTEIITFPNATINLNGQS